MSTLRNLLFAAGFASLGAFMALGAQAAAGPHSGGPFGPQMARLADSLDLTDDQQAMVDEMRTEAQAHRQAAREDRTASRAQLKEMLGQETIDAEVVHGLIDDRINEMAGFAHGMADKFIALHATLDEDQRDALIEAVDEAAARGSEHRQQRGGKRGGGDR